MNAHVLFLALRGALLPLLVWAAHLTPVVAGGWSPIAATTLNSAACWPAAARSPSIAARR